MKITNTQKCLHCSSVFSSRNALFVHLRAIGAPNLKPEKTISEIREARRRRKDKLAFQKFIMRYERLSLN
jgi:hypothetical protein